MKHSMKKSMMDKEDIMDTKKGIKQSAKEELSDAMMTKRIHHATTPVQKGKIKKTGSFQGKSNKLGFGGRSAQLKARGVPAGVIGMLARKAGAAKGMKHYHGK